MKNSNYLLVICPIGLGNFLMASHSLRQLKEQAPELRLCLLALKPGIAELAQSTNWFKHIFCWDPDNENLVTGFRVITRIRKLRIKNSLHLYPSLDRRFLVFSVCAGVKNIWRVGAGEPARFPFLNINALNKNEYDTHDAELNIKLASAFIHKPIPSEYIDGYKFIVKSKNSYADKFKVGYLAVHPGSSAQRGMDKKRWPADNYAHLINKIFDQFGITSLIVGDQSEADLKKYIQQKCQNKSEIAEPGSVDYLSSILNGALLYMGNDSGVMHTAVYLKKRCIVFFGPTNEYETGPYYLNSHDFKNANPPHRGHLCLRKQPLADYNFSISANLRKVYNNGGGLENLTVDEVWPQINLFIQSILDLKK